MGSGGGRYGLWGRTAGQHGFISCRPPAVRSRHPQARRAGSRTVGARLLPGVRKRYHCRLRRRGEAAAGQLRLPADSDAGPRPHANRGRAAFPHRALRALHPVRASGQRREHAGKIKADALGAIAGKTEGTGQHDDWGRVWADVALREWTSKFLGIPADDVAKQVIFVLSGGCPGVITPHIAVVTREWVEVADAGSNIDKSLVVGRAGSEPMPPEEVCRMGQIPKVPEPPHPATADAAPP